MRVDGVGDQGALNKAAHEAAEEKEQNENENESQEGGGSGNPDLAPEGGDREREKEQKEKEKEKNMGKQNEKEEKRGDGAQCTEEAGKESRESESLGSKDEGPGMHRPDPSRMEPELTERQKPGDVMMAENTGGGSVVKEEKGDDGTLQLSIDARYCLCPCYICLRGVYCVLRWYNP